MNVSQRIEVLMELKSYLLQNNESLQAVKLKASQQNGWFSIDFIDLAIKNICDAFLEESKLTEWLKNYDIAKKNPAPKTVGIVMAGNIPLVGFHDFLCVFITGNRSLIKLSSKDDLLLKHLVEKMTEWNDEVKEMVVFAERLKDCDAYIATGSNNSGRYFEYYFGKYPHIIRRNRTSIAILDNTETQAELDSLADDIQLYFGLGCRNVTKLYVPKDYDFIPLLTTLRKYAHVTDNHKYKHNYDYHLALLIMNSKYYMNNDSLILTENVSPFSPVSQVHYEFYNDINEVKNSISVNDDIQCIVGHGYTPFGEAQTPTLTDYADGVDTMTFLRTLANGE